MAEVARVYVDRRGADRFRVCRTMAGGDGFREIGHGPTLRAALADSLGWIGAELARSIAADAGSVDHAYINSLLHWQGELIKACRVEELMAMQAAA